ncbi:MAG TPA: hypothetical protein VL117_03295 [Thermoleophilia bacterium]|nr:hypothetical protein [Thermoleophilia bacterium]
MTQASSPTHRRRPSPALLVAMLALLVSLGGTAAAAHVLITSKDIKNGTIRLVDLSPDTKKALHAHAVVADSAGFAERSATLTDAASFAPIVASTRPTPGTLLPLDASGRFPAGVMPDIAARVYSTHDQVTHLQIAHGPVYQVVFDKVSFDTDGMFDPARPTVLTAPTPGIYLITTNVSWAIEDTSRTGANRAVYLDVDGHAVAVDQRPPADETRQVVTTIYKLAAGDTVQVGIGQDAGDLTANAVGDYAPSLAMAWIAPG